MTSAHESSIAAVPLERPSLAGRLWGGALAAWGAFIGLLPHVLHHVGPLAGAALLAGATGTVLFAAVGFVAAMFTLSSFVLGPAISGGGDSGRRPVEQPGGGHAAHH